MLRLLIGIILGVALAFACVWGIEAIGGRYFPIAPGYDVQLATYSQSAMAAVTLQTKLLVTLGWCVGTAAGGALAEIVAHRSLAVWFVAGFVVAGAASTLAVIPHPGWLIAAGLLLPWLCAWAVKGAVHWHRHP